MFTEGFGQSPALQAYLERFVLRYTAVAKGVVLRALNKAHGSERIT